MRRTNPHYNGWKSVIARACPVRFFVRYIWYPVYQCPLYRGFTVYQKLWIVNFYNCTRLSVSKWLSPNRYGSRHSETKLSFTFFFNLNHLDIKLNYWKMEWPNLTSRHHPLLTSLSGITMKNYNVEKIYTYISVMIDLWWKSHTAVCYIGANDFIKHGNFFTIRRGFYFLCLICAIM